MSHGPAKDRWFDGRVRHVISVRRLAKRRGHRGGTRIETLECGHSYVPDIRPDGAFGNPAFQYRVCWACPRVAP